MVTSLKQTNTIVLNSLGLPVIKSVKDFSDYLHLSYSLVYILSRNTVQYKYKTFEIPKKQNGKRLIYSPVYSLKVIQHWILNKILYNIKPSNNCYGYIKGMSSPLTKNADKHKANMFIMKLDIENFFQSLGSHKVYGLFKSIGYNQEVAMLLTNLCTCDGHIPQGAVTSPYLSNLLCIKLDTRLHKYCSKRDIVYTRYVDDLTFSSNNRYELKKIFHMVSIILANEGFTINKNKIRFLTPKTKKTITGVTISDDKLKAPYQMKKLVRSMIHRAIVSGNYENVCQIKGYIAYISSIEDDYLIKIKKYINSFSEKSVCLFQEVVTAYNQNKFFSELIDFQLKKSTDFVGFPDNYEFENYEYSERDEYLEKCNIASV